MAVRDRGLPRLRMFAAHLSHSNFDGLVHAHEF